MVKHGNRKYEDDENYFTIWSGNMAYILGILAADGCVSKNGNVGIITISLHEKDKEIVNFIRDEISPDRPIYNEIQTQKSGLTTPKVKLKISNTYISKQLIDLGIKNRKTYDPGYPVIPKEYKADFLRGFFDGDGSIKKRLRKNSKLYHYSIVICCYSKNFLEKMIQDNDIEYGKIYRGHGTWDWEVNRKDDISKFESYIYNGGFCLKRKHDRFLERDKICNNRRYLSAFGETKSVINWSKDSRCNVTYANLCKRLSMYKNILPEILISTGDVPYWNYFSSLNKRG